MRRYYHGSPTPLEEGQTLLPAHWLGLLPRAKTVNQPNYSPMWVYVSTDPQYAACFGTVYVVQPIGPVEPDPDAKKAWRCRRAKVVRREDALRSFLATQGVRL